MNLKFMSGNLEFITMNFKLFHVNLKYSSNYSGLLLVDWRFSAKRPEWAGFYQRFTLGNPALKQMNESLETRLTEFEALCFYFSTAGQKR